MSELTSKEKLKIVVNALEDKKAINTRVIDISQISVVADYFVIVSGSNTSQVQALSDNVLEELSKVHVHCNQIEGYNSANWILMDYGDIIVHVFNHDDRLFYDLERIWRDGKILELPIE